MPCQPASSLPSFSLLGPPHPNCVDRKRIERALEKRQRYRYVHPCVVDDAAGYRIKSPCCSRNIDAAGGMIDIARLLWAETRWQLYARQRDPDGWRLYAETTTLAAALAILLPDRDRVFWP